MDTPKQMNNPTEPISAPAGATYRGSENVPSVRTLLLPTPRFPKFDTQPDSTVRPESADTPATVNPHLDDRTRQALLDHPVTAKLRLRQGTLEPTDAVIADPGHRPLLRGDL